MFMAAPWCRGGSIHVEQLRKTHMDQEEHTSFGVFKPVGHTVISFPSAKQAADFIAKPGAGDAVKLRQWDDLAKVAGAATPPLAHFIERASRCTTRSA